MCLAPLPNFSKVSELHLHVPGINYHTLNKYVTGKHGAKIEVVRKAQAAHCRVAPAHTKRRYA